MRVREKVDIFDYQSGKSRGILIHLFGMKFVFKSEIRRSTSSRKSPSLASNSTFDVFSSEGDILAGRKLEGLCGESPPNL